MKAKQRVKQPTPRHDETTTITQGKHQPEQVIDKQTVKNENINKHSIIKVMARTYTIPAGAFFVIAALAESLQIFLDDIDDRLHTLEQQGTGGAGVTREQFETLRSEVGAVRGIAKSAYNRKCPSNNTAGLSHRISQLESKTNRISAAIKVW